MAHLLLLYFLFVLHSLVYGYEEHIENFNKDKTRPSNSYTNVPQFGKSAKSRSFYDFQAQAVAYKDLSDSVCYIERIKLNYLNSGKNVNKNIADSTYVNILQSEFPLSKNQVWALAGSRIYEFCRGYPTYFLQYSPTKDNDDDINTNSIHEVFSYNGRSKRSANNDYHYGGRVRGQTQSQYLNYGNNNQAGKAEAESTYGGTRAVVSGISGMGQAQSQSLPVGCEGCYSQDDRQRQVLQFGKTPGGSRPLGEIRQPGRPGEEYYRPGEGRPEIPTGSGINGYRPATTGGGQEISVGPEGEYRPGTSRPDGTNGGTVSGRFPGGERPTDISGRIPGEGINGKPPIGGEEFYRPGESGVSGGTGTGDLPWRPTGTTNGLYRPGASDTRIPTGPAGPAGGERPIGPGGVPIPGISGTGRPTGPAVTPGGERPVGPGGVYRPGISGTGRPTGPAGTPGEEGPIGTDGLYRPGISETGRPTGSAGTSGGERPIGPGDVSETGRPSEPVGTPDGERPIGPGGIYRPGISEIGPTAPTGTTDGERPIDGGVYRPGISETGRPTGPAGIPGGEIPVGPGDAYRPGISETGRPTETTGGERPTDPDGVYRPGTTTGTIGGERPTPDDRYTPGRRPIDGGITDRWPSIDGGSVGPDGTYRPDSSRPDTYRPGTQRPTGPSEEFYRPGPGTPDGSVETSWRPGQPDAGGRPRRPGGMIEETYEPARPDGTTARRPGQGIPSGTNGVGPDRGAFPGEPAGHFSGHFSGSYNGYGGKTNGHYGVNGNQRPSETDVEQFGHSNGQGGKFSGKFAGDYTPHSGQFAGKFTGQYGHTRQDYAQQPDGQDTYRQDLFNGRTPTSIPVSTVGNGVHRPDGYDTRGPSKLPISGEGDYEQITHGGTRGPLTPTGVDGENIYDGRSPQTISANGVGGRPTQSGRQDYHGGTNNDRQFGGKFAGDYVPHVGDTGRFTGQFSGRYGPSEIANEYSRIETSGRGGAPSRGTDGHVPRGDDQYRTTDEYGRPIQQPGYDRFSTHGGQNGGRGQHLAPGVSGQYDKLVPGTTGDRLRKPYEGTQSTGDYGKYKPTNGDYGATYQHRQPNGYYGKTDQYGNPIIEEDRLQRGPQLNGQISPDGTWGRKPGTNAQYQTPGRGYGEPSNGQSGTDHGQTGGGVSSGGNGYRRPSNGYAGVEHGQTTTGSRIGDNGQGGRVGDSHSGVGRGQTTGGTGISGNEFGGLGNGQSGVDRVPIIGGGNGVSADRNGWRGVTGTGTPSGGYGGPGRDGPVTSSGGYGQPGTDGQSGIDYGQGRGPYDQGRGPYDQGTGSDGGRGANGDETSYGESRPYSKPGTGHSQEIDRGSGINGQTSPYGENYQYRPGVGDGSEAGLNGQGRPDGPYQYGPDRSGITDLVGGDGRDSSVQSGNERYDNDSDSQAQSSVQHVNNETQASASAQGRHLGGTAQSQVSGVYSGSGSFSASAGTIDGKRGAQTQVAGGKEGALSSAQGVGGIGQSQAQVQVASSSGDTTSSAQSSGDNHGTNTQVQAGGKGGMADAQANGLGSTSSQAQIGFSPYDKNEKDDQSSPFRGGGTASSQSGSYTGQSQAQIQGKFRYGIKYSGAAQAGSGSNATASRNQTRPEGLTDIFQPLKPITYTSGSNYNEQSQHVSANVNPDVSAEAEEDLQEAVTTTQLPYIDNESYELSKTADSDDYYDMEESAEAAITQQPFTRTLIRQASKSQRQHIILDPLEDLDAIVTQDQDPDLPQGAILQPGAHIPGSPGYKIPQGFRGKVSSTAGEYTSARGPNSQAQSVTLTPGAGHITYKKPVYTVLSNTQLRNGGFGYGTSYTYQPVQYQLKSGKSYPRFVSVTKSETGSQNTATGKKTPSVYYTQTSTCGYFTNTCVYNNGKKICLPRPKTNPDGTPVKC